MHGDACLEHFHYSTTTTVAHELMTVGLVASSAVGHDSAANGGGSREEGAAPAEERALAMRVQGKMVAAPVDGAGAPAEIAVEGDESEEEDEEDEEEGDESKEEADEEEEEEKWLGQYSSTQSILLVGDGDFSFSLALATGFGSGENLVATSLDTYEALGKKFDRAKSNITGLKSLGATVLHGIDVQTMKLQTDLKYRRFDRIVYNFPHAGFKGKESDLHVINLHKKLVRAFFCNARHLLRPYGEIHISHKTGECYDEWDLEGLAAKYSLLLVEKVGFQEADYPGYHPKRGDGPDCDKPFPLGTCFTFKFKFGGSKKQKKQNGRRAGAISSVGGDTRPCHPLPLVQPCSGLQFVPGAYTTRMPMTLPPHAHVVDQRQQPGTPLKFIGIPRATFIYRALQVHCSAPQGHQSSLMNALGTPGRIPSPMSRVTTTSLLAPQGYPRYEERTIAEPQGNTDDYFACEYRRSLLREYGIKRQLMPGGTCLNYSAFLEARQWESVQRQERLRRMIAYGSQ